MQSARNRVSGCRGVRTWGCLGSLHHKGKEQLGSCQGLSCAEELEGMYVWEQLSKRRKSSLISRDRFQAPAFLLASRIALLAFGCNNRVGQNPLKC